MDPSRAKLLKKHGVSVRVFEAFLEVLAKRYEGRVWPTPSPVESRRKWVRKKRTPIVVGHEFQGRVVLSWDGTKWAVECRACGRVRMLTTGAVHVGNKCWCQTVRRRK